MAYSHPLGCAIVVSALLLVGAILPTDAGDVFCAVLRDPVARRFGIGVGVLVAFFFVSIAGNLSFLPEEGGPHRTNVIVGSIVLFAGRLVYSVEAARRPDRTSTIVPAD